MLEQSYYQNADKIIESYGARPSSLIPVDVYKRQRKKRRTILWQSSLPLVKEFTVFPP